MIGNIPLFFRDMAPQKARLSIWNRKFAPAFERLAGVTLQKISASDDGYLILSVYKPGDDRSAVIFNIRKGSPGVSTSVVKPQAQKTPNGFVQIARKYLMGRRVRTIFASLSPIALFLEFEPIQTSDEESDLLPVPDTLILDFDAHPPRVCLARTHNSPPERYSSVKPGFPLGSLFFESYCEWSLDYTKTKRRPTFENAVLPFCILDPASHKHQEGNEESVVNTRDSTTANTPVTAAPKTLPIATETLKSPQQMLTLFPTHVRRAIRTRLQFFERRSVRQRQDLPNEIAIDRLSRQCLGIQSNLYMWSRGASVWFVPANLIEEFGLPPQLSLKQGESPGDLLSGFYRELERMKRRREELLSRISEGENKHQVFQNLVVQAEQDLNTAFAKALDDERDPKEAAILIAKHLPASATRLCKELEVAWLEGAQKKAHQKATQARQVPWRSFRSSTGEFIRVAKSSHDGDLMIKEMPSNHFWLHILTGEGSHVWLECPRKSRPSAAAIREAGILAVYHSKQGKGREGEVRVATRADIEKKKDLAPGKVLVRRCETIVVRFQEEELQPILATQKSTTPHG